MAKLLSDKEINEKIEKPKDSKLYNQIQLDFFSKKELRLIIKC